MLTTDALRQEGVAVDEGLQRCMNMEAFYLNLVEKALRNEGMKTLSDALAEKDLDKAFEAAHGLKGMYANLSLTPVETPIREITELLRIRKDMDYQPLLKEAVDALERLRSYL